MATVRRSRLTATLAVVLTGLLGVMVWRRPILQAMASGWVVNDLPVKASAIVVLGGSPESRPFMAARLFKDGFAPRILLPRVKPGPAERLGLKQNDTGIAKSILLHEGIPESAIDLIGTDVSSTVEETEAVRQWLQGQPAESGATVLIPTETFYTRRTRWIFRRTLGESTTPVIIAIPSRTYSTDDWWQHEEGLIDFQNEVIKFIYYIFKY